MARVTSHTLNAIDGTHAGGIGVVLSAPDGAVLIDAETDAGGRLDRDIPAAEIDPNASYQLVFATGPYWASRGLPQRGPQIVGEIVIRFHMPDTEGRYHIPVILSPNGYSVWWSA